VLIVGSKVDYKPFGFRDPSGESSASNPYRQARRRQARRQARDRAGRLVEPHAVSAARQDRLMIATMNDKPDRRQHRRIIEPLYYASGGTCSPNKKAPLRAGNSSRARKSGGIQAPWSTSRWPKNTAPTSWHSKARRGGGRAAARQLRRWVYDDTAFAERLADANGPASRWRGDHHGRGHGVSP